MQIEKDSYFPNTSREISGTPGEVHHTEETQNREIRGGKPTSIGLQWQQQHYLTTQSYDASQPMKRNCYKTNFYRVEYAGNIHSLEKAANSSIIDFLQLLQLQRYVNFLVDTCGIKSVAELKVISSSSSGGGRWKVIKDQLEKEPFIRLQNALRTFYEPCSWCKIMSKKRKPLYSWGVRILSNTWVASTRRCNKEKWALKDHASNLQSMFKTANNKIKVSIQTSQKEKKSASAKSKCDQLLKKREISHAKSSDDQLKKAKRDAVSETKAGALDKVEDNDFTTLESLLMQASLHEYIIYLKDLGFAEVDDFKFLPQAEWDELNAVMGATNIDRLKHVVEANWNGTHSVSEYGPISSISAPQDATSDSPSADDDCIDGSSPSDREEAKWDGAHSVSEYGVISSISAQQDAANDRVSAGDGFNDAFSPSDREEAKWDGSHSVSEYGAISSISAQQDATNDSASAGDDINDAFSPSDREEATSGNGNMHTSANGNSSLSASQGVDESFVQFLNKIGCRMFLDFFVDGIGIDKVLDFKYCTNDIWKAIETKLSAPIRIIKLKHALRELGIPVNDSEHHSPQHQLELGDAVNDSEHHHAQHQHLQQPQQQMAFPLPQMIPPHSQIPLQIQMQQHIYPSQQQQYFPVQQQQSHFQQQTGTLPIQQQQLLLLPYQNLQDHSLQPSSIYLSPAQQQPFVPPNQSNSLFTPFQQGPYFSPQQQQQQQMFQANNDQQQRQAPQQLAPQTLKVNQHQHIVVTPQNIVQPHHYYPIFAVQPTQDSLEKLNSLQMGGQPGNFYTDFNPFNVPVIADRMGSCSFSPQDLSQNPGQTLQLYPDATPPAVQNQLDEEPFDQKVMHLCGMGFEEADVKEALTKHKGDKQAAANELLKTL